jgi:uncharacterized protein (DUF934 family)
MPQLIKNRQLATSDWVCGEGVAAAGKRLLPLPDYLTAMSAGEPAAARAVLLKPEDLDLAPLLPHLSHLPLIAVHFGSTGEGRGYTQGRLLRERHGFRGELRAVGKIRADQIYFLARCGFDAFELADGEDPATAIAQLDRFSVAYQPGVGALAQPRRRSAGRQ